MVVQVFEAFFYSLVKLVFVFEEVHLDFKHMKSLQNVMFYHKLSYFTVYMNTAEAISQLISRLIENLF